MSPIEADEEVKEKKEELKILISNKLLTRPAILPSQIKAGNNSNQLKTNILCIRIVNSP